MSNINFEHKDLTLTRDLIRKLNQLEGGGSGGVLVLEGTLSGSNPYTATIDWQQTGGYTGLKEAYDSKNAIFIVLRSPLGVTANQKDTVLTLSSYENEVFKFTSDTFECDFPDITDPDKYGKPCIANIGISQSSSVTVVDFSLTFPNEIVKYNGSIINPGNQTSQITIATGYSEIETLLYNGVTVALDMTLSGQDETVACYYTGIDSNGDLIFSNYKLYSDNFRVIEVHFVEENYDYALIQNYQLSDQASTADIEVTYNEIVTLINDGELIPNQAYRITDFSTTSASSEFSTNVTGNVIALHVVASTTTQLFPEAKAFSSGNLLDWKILYDVNNDTSKYEWADTVNGKGVIYYLEDERGNCCDYDFKNIKFLDSDGINYYFTFNDEYNYSDLSVYPDCRNNVIKSIRSTDGRFHLPNIVMTVQSGEYGSFYENVFEYCHSIKAVNMFYGNTLVNCTSCAFGRAYRNTLCNMSGITASDYFAYNTIQSATNSTFGVFFQNNTIGHNFKATVGNYVKYNTFGENFYNNEVQNRYQNCVFGNGITSATFVTNGTEIDYVHVMSGFTGTFDGALYDYINNPSIFVSRTSTGVVKTYSIADLVK